MTRADDLILPFTLASMAVRGRIVRLGPAVDDILTRHGQPAPVSAQLGEALALGAALAGALKFDGRFTLQTRGDGPIRMLVADLTSDGDMRGCAQLAEDTPLPDRITAPVPDLLGTGQLAFTVDQGRHTQLYQGLVDLDGATLAECLQHYFRQSDQLDNALLGWCDRRGGAWRAGALAIQRLPTTGPAEDQAREDWHRALTLMASARADEALDPDLPAPDLLFRLFHEEGVQVFAPKPLRHRCRCSAERVEAVLRGLSHGELAEMKGDDDHVAVTCEYCNTRYVYDDDVLATLTK